MEQPKFLDGGSSSGGGFYTAQDVTQGNQNKITRKEKE